MGFLLSTTFPPLLFACLVATEPISLMFVLAEMLTILKGLEICFSPAIPVHSYLSLSSLTYLMVTVSSFVLKSYLLTSDIASAFMSLVARSSDPSYGILVYR